MGVVYKAKDSSANRPVAIKLIQGSASMSHRGRIGLVREARVAGDLNHHNIVRIYDIGQYRGWLYLVMEYLSGMPLNRLMQSSESLSVNGKLKILIQLCEALDHAHNRGVIHRDIKPANTFIVGHDRLVKVVDFGLAIKTEATGDGRLAGTFPYMSPEQFSGQKLDYSTDVWSAGVTAYELLTGQLPFRGGTPTELRREILTAPPPRFDSSVPLADELDRVVQRTLAKNQKDRCTARELSRELRSLSESLETNVDSETARVEVSIDSSPQAGERSTSDIGSPDHYAHIDLGFNQPSVGRVTIRHGRFQVRRLQRSVHEIKAWIIPSSFASTGGDRAGFILGLIALPPLLLLQILEWALAAVDIVMRHPHCRNCGLTMSLTGYWARLVKSNTEVVLGYKDCVAALKESLWEDAAKLLCVHGSAGSVSYGHELISTPLRYHLEFYECGICSDHAARLTTDDLIEQKWISRLDFTEAYRGEPASVVATLKRIGSLPSHLARTTAGCVRHALHHSNPIEPNIPALSTIALFGVIAAGVVIQSKHNQKVRWQLLHSSPSMAGNYKGRSLSSRYAPDSSERAMQYYDIATTQGIGKERGLAANALGEMYEKGLGIPRDYTKAIFWYRTAAGLHGNTDAMTNLARMYENGIGVKRDLATAQYWYISAGDRQAANRISQRNRNRSQ